MHTSHQTERGFSTIFVLVIVAVVALGILALVVVNNTNFKTVSEVPVSIQDEQVKKLEVQSSSDEIGPIEKDLVDTNLNNLDQGTDQIEKDSSGI